MKVIQTGNGKIEIDVEGDLLLAQKIYAFITSLKEKEELG